MISLGVACLTLGFLFGVPALWTVGVILLAVGLLLALVGHLGHVGGHRHYY